MAEKKFIAKEPLFIGRARAFNTGDPVPAGHVEKYDWADKVAREGTKAAQEASGPDSA